jgi:hypothetical protein
MRPTLDEILTSEFFMGRVRASVPFLSCSPSKERTKSTCRILEDKNRWV